MPKIDSVSGMTNPPRHGKIYLCRYGFHGATQLALFLGYRGDGYVVRKWLSNSERWTNQLVIAQKDLLRPATLAQCTAVRLDVGKL